MRPLPRVKPVMDTCRARCVSWRLAYSTASGRRLRRSEGQKPGQVGRPRAYAPDVSDKHEGAPKLSVRLEPELFSWVRDQGGGTWLRHTARELQRLSQEPGFRPWWDDLRLPD